MSAPVDVQLVLAGDGRYDATIDGRSVRFRSPRSSCPAHTLDALSRAITAAAWAAKRSPAEEIADPASSLFEVRG